MLLNQPQNGCLGEILKERLRRPYPEFTIVSAFAKNSGVLRLKPAMEAFRARGGRIQAYLGIDAHGTSYEALLNLLSLCDAVYIVHSANPYVTFHPKAYLFSGEDERFLAVGSNNLTCGGLWTNFECAVCLETDGGDERVLSLERQLARYRDPEEPCSFVLTREGADRLLEEGLVKKEARLRLEGRTVFRDMTGAFPPFGRPAPDALRGQHGRPDEEVRAVAPIEENDRQEFMWFETRSLTGGSRNILDLSKLGKLVSGSGAGLRYETDHADFVLGGVAFFDISPEETAREKTIAINYNGVDFFGNTVKFPVGEKSNGSWRLQLNGRSQNGERLHTVGGNEWLRYKILLFEKIATDYYVLSVAGEESLREMEEKSVFVATNGSARDSKKYGLL